MGLKIHNALIKNKLILWEQRRSVLPSSRRPDFMSTDEKFSAYSSLTRGRYASRRGLRAAGCVSRYVLRRGVARVQNATRR